jgi:undecaprenyl-diphosphatase
MVDLIQAAVLAVVQGITAWIPVSSKTQVILAGNWLFGISFKDALAFALMLHLGDFAAAVYRYRDEYLNAVKSAAANPYSLLDFSSRDYPDKEHSFLFVSIAATAVLALPLYFLSKNFLAGLQGEWLLAAAGLLLITMSVIMWASREGPSPAEAETLERTEGLTLKSSIITGLAQGLAVLPGISRSGITQAALLSQGFKPDEAVRLSFLMAAPMILAAFAAFAVVEGFSGISIEAAALGIIISAAVSLGTMDVITRAAERIPAHYFSAAVGILALVPLAIVLSLGLSG